MTLSGATTLTQNNYAFSLDVISLYTTLPAHPANDIILEHIIVKNAYCHKRTDIHLLLSIIVDNTYLPHNGNIFKETTGLFMVFSISGIQAILYMDQLERYQSAHHAYSSQDILTISSCWHHLAKKPPPYMRSSETLIDTFSSETLIDTFSLDGASLKLVDKFTYLGSRVSSTEKDIDTRLTKAWTAIDRLSIIWKSDLTDKMKRSFFQAAVVSILLYGCTTWTLTKRLERRLDGNYTRMLRAVLNKSWWQHPTRLQLYGHLPPITKTIQVRRTRHAGHCWRSKDELISDVLLWTPHMDVQEWDDQHELTYSNYVRTQDVTLKTCRRRWMIGRNGERGSGISALAARHDDDEHWLPITSRF